MYVMETIFACRSYEDMEREVSQIIGFRWYALDDKHFRLLPLDLNITYNHRVLDEIQHLK